eukprot:ANDGO_02136.mRNA.1 putative pre-mRNA-splicing factor ATP-dependent RNA helicase mog-5
MDALARLSLVNRVCSAVESHTLINDTVLSEFLINLAENAATQSEFRRKVVESGGDSFSLSLVDHVYALVKASRGDARVRTADSSMLSTARAATATPSATSATTTTRSTRSAKSSFGSALEMPNGVFSAVDPHISVEPELIRPHPDRRALDQSPRKRPREKTEYEKWEDTQLQHALSSKQRSQDDPLDDSGTGMGDDDEGVRRSAGISDSAAHHGEEIADFEVEIKDEAPTFLRNDLQRRGLKMIGNEADAWSTVKVIRNPEGSLQRAAYLASQTAKQRSEERVVLKRSSLSSSSLSLQSAETEIGKEDDVDGEDAFIPVSFGPRQQSASMSDQRKSLPIYKFRSNLLEIIRDNQIVVVIGETGSGKTTQMTQYILEDGLVAPGKRVACTQPRRVAAVSVAKRVSEEKGCRVGTLVGYNIRFDDCTSRDTMIEYMTDGMLLRQCLLDTDLSLYSVIILDEAHERTIHTDVLFGLCKAAVAKRPDLRLIVTSATLEAEKFASYFRGAPIFRIPGRSFPVEILYAKEPEQDYLEGAVTTVLQIHSREPEGDILLFLTGQEEIETACDMIKQRSKSMAKERIMGAGAGACAGTGNMNLIVLPVFSALPSEMQSQIFDPAPKGYRKCVVATNIAETSITIDGILYVVDPGFSKQKCYNPKSGMDSLLVVPISQASANQRAGRAGRTAPGKCYRLYTDQAFREEMHPTTIPEIQRTNLGHTVLMLKAMGINDLLHFDFLDPPPQQALLAAMHALFLLSALDDDGLLTPLGRRMAEFPLDPMMSKALLAAVDLSCADEMLIILGLISVGQSVFFRPREKQEQADRRRSRFNQAEGDHITLLTVYREWKNAKYSSTWCHDNYIQLRSLKRAEDVSKQLRRILDRQRLRVSSCGSELDRIRIALCAGYFSQVAKADSQEKCYKTLVDQTPVHVHPSSALHGRQPRYVIYHEVVLTSKEYMRQVTAIDPRWLLKVAPGMFGKAEGRVSMGEKVKPLWDRRWEDENDWRISKQKRRRN